MAFMGDEIALSYGNPGHLTTALRISHKEFPKYGGTPGSARIVPAKTGGLFVSFEKEGISHASRKNISQPF
jgi:hypothetical protein